VAGGRQARAGLQLIHGESDKHSGRSAAAVWQRAGAQKPSPGFQQRVVPPLRGAASIRLIIVGRYRASESVEDRGPDRGGFTGEGARQPAGAIRQDRQGDRSAPLVVLLGDQLPVRVQTSRHGAGQHREPIRIEFPRMAYQGWFDLGNQLRLLREHPVGQPVDRGGDNRGVSSRDRPLRQRCGDVRESRLQSLASNGPSQPQVGGHPNPAGGLPPANPQSLGQ